MTLAETTKRSETLAELAKHKSANVRGSVSRNANTSKTTLSELANDENWIIRLNVIYNPNTSKSTLSKLANDDVKVVQEAAKRQLP